MDGINKNLNKSINRECLIKAAITKARKDQEDKRPITRRRIEDVLATKKLEADLGLSC